MSVGSAGSRFATAVAVVLGWLSLWLPAAASAQPAYALPRIARGDELGRYMSTHQDREGKLTIGDMTRADVQARFRPCTTEAPSFGLTDAPTWLRFSIENSHAEVLRWMLEVAYPHLDHVELYVPREDGLWELRRTGDAYPFAEREVDHRNFLFQLDAPAHERRTYYMRVQTSGTLSLPVLAWTSDALIAHQERELPLMWMLYGVLLVMALYNSFLYVSLRRVEYLYYVLYNLALLALQFALTGQAFQFLLPETPWLANRLMPAVGATLLWSSSRFIWALLELPETLPGFGRFFQYFSHLALGLLGLSLFGPYIVAVRATLFLMFFITVVGAYCSMILAYRGMRIAQFLLLAWAALLAGVLLPIAKAMGYLPNSFFTEWGLQLGAGVEIVLLSLALADRINMLQMSLGEVNDQLSHTVLELQAALDTAEQATRAKGDFLATMSHELRTPLNSIINIPQGLMADFARADAAVCQACNSLFELEAGDTVTKDSVCPHCQAAGALRTQRVTRYVGRPEQSVQHLALIERAGKHLLQMVNGVLDFSKLEARAMRLMIQSVEVGVLVTESIDTVSELAKRANIPLLVEVEPELRVQTLMADPLRVKQVLINLLANAIKFSDGRGSVTLGVQRDQQSLVFWVRDAGIGIAREHLEKIFERFEQVEQGDTRRYGGTGLGLSISRSLVEMHEGTIWVESTQNVGSTFSFRLPIAGPAHVANDHGEEPISVVLGRVQRLPDNAQTSKELSS